MMPKHPPYARIRKIPDGFEVSCETEHWDRQSFNEVQFSHTLLFLRSGERIIEEPDVFDETFSSRAKSVLGSGKGEDRIFETARDLIGDLHASRERFKESQRKKETQK